MQEMINLMKLQGSLSQNARAAVKTGTISGYDPANYMAKVLIYPGDQSDPDNIPLETSWIPVFSPWVGNGWGMFCPPAIGNLVDVHFQEGSLQTSYVSLRTFNDEDRPLNVPPGEFWLVHASGAFIKLTNDGHISIHGAPDVNITATNANITTTANTVMNVSGTTTINSTGAVNVNSSTVNLGNGALTALLNGLAQSIYNTHTHPVTSDPDTGPPTQQMGSSTLTTNTKAS